MTTYAIVKPYENNTTKNSSKLPIKLAYNKHVRRQSIIGGRDHSQSEYSKRQLSNNKGFNLVEKIEYQLKESTCKVSALGVDQINSEKQENRIIILERHNKALTLELKMLSNCASQLIDMRNMELQASKPILTPAKVVSKSLEKIPAKTDSTTQLNSLANEYRQLTERLKTVSDGEFYMNLRSKITTLNSDIEELNKRKKLCEINAKKKDKSLTKSVRDGHTQIFETVKACQRELNTVKEQLYSLEHKMLTVLEKPKNFISKEGEKTSKLYTQLQEECYSLDIDPKVVEKSHQVISPKKKEIRELTQSKEAIKIDITSIESKYKLTQRQLASQSKLLSDAIDKLSQQLSAEETKYSELIKQLDDLLQKKKTKLEKVQTQCSSPYQHNIEKSHILKAYIELRQHPSYK